MNSKEYFDKDYYYGCKKSNYLNYENYRNNQYWARIVKKIKKLKINGRILDIGCAFGYFLEKVNSLFEELHGVDISEFAIKKAKIILPEAELKVLDLNKNELPYPNQYFDIVTAFDVLEHTDSVEEILKKIIPKIKIGGYLVISMPIQDTILNKIFKIFDKDKSHINIISRKQIGLLIKRYDSKIISQSFFLDFFGVKLRCIHREIEIIIRKEQ